MKKLTFISIGMIALSVGNAHAALCNDWGDAIGVAPPYTEAAAKKLIASCTRDNVYGDPHCATLDYTTTFVWFSDDGSCQYLESCATCPSGYKMGGAPAEYAIGDVCYVGDEAPNGYTQDMLESQYNEYYYCDPIPISCATGYYGVTSNGTTGCTQCPTWTGVYTNSARTTLARGTSTTGGNTSIVDCYIPDGTYYDTTGTFKLNSYCYYKK